MPENDEKTIGKIKESLDFLDSSVEVRKPDFMEFVKLVNETEEKKAEKGNRQFATFLLTAVFVVLLETFAFSKSAVVFVAVQAAALISIPAVVLWNRKLYRQVSEK